MDPFIAAQADAGNTPNNTKKLAIGWMLPYLLVVSFAGLFSIVALRKMMIMKYKLTYPSGTATAYLINCSTLLKEQSWPRNKLVPYSNPLASALYLGLFNGYLHVKMAADLVACLHLVSKPMPKSSILIFPQHMLELVCFALMDPLMIFIKIIKLKVDTHLVISDNKGDLSVLCPYMVNVSLLIGAIVSWAIMWPMIEAKKGDWYSAQLSAASLHGIQGYRVFIAISMMLGDGLFHFAYMLVVTVLSFRNRKSGLADSSSEESFEDYDKKRQNEYFLKDQIPNWAAIGGYVGIAIISIIVVPIIFHSLKWYHILVAYLIAPILAFCNSYGSGLTDWSLASNYGKIAILTFSYWVGLQNGGVIAGLASCGLMMSILDTAAGLMGDFKTGYLTLTSPRSMFFSQVIGTAMGCVITPLVFWIFNSAYRLGDPEGAYPAPYASMYRGIALLGVEGFGSLPKHCLRLSVWFFVAAIVINLLTQLLKKFEPKYGIYRCVPSPMCMAIPFYLGGYFAIDMCVGSLILFIWQMVNKQQAKDFGPALASGLICGEPLWGIPAPVLALAGVKAPFCMKVRHGGA
uniref:Uncharacterized protein A17 n=1 Tax=Nicotiana tabacum TaxID=4097 RepID=Q8H0H1_TOBAC|nr:hypothetical protein [Nicotiana tabacum]